MHNQTYMQLADDSSSLTMAQQYMQKSGISGMQDSFVNQNSN
jgi:hypothetical protein